ncbi:helix-turn-helix transcriptional regulator [Tumebacillus flagellatus]|uniref:HTH cro/C1-type domain-containing protein n=1 Tax=Tumebacillus flagellatus TaxID=1157490 RepID=A0A074LP37_9BACL|nr:helix-turn-helix transcriptional regulator [Tumebacillus flagellatus]KEO81588.1 hypothetical protein EL26_20095 [Tumebacillus flagellatus]
MNALGEKIKDLREARGWLQKELAEKAEVSPATISGVENGRFAPSPEILFRLSKTLDAEFIELVEMIPDLTVAAWLEVIMLVNLERKFAKALELVYRVRENFPSMQDYQRDQLTYAEAALMTVEDHTRIQALQVLYSMAEKWEDKVNANPLFVMQLHYTLGGAWHRRMEFVMALHHYKRSADIIHQHPELQNYRTVPTLLYAIGDSLRFLGRFQEAISYLQRALPKLIDQTPETNYAVGGCYFALGNTYKNLGDHSKAADMFFEAIPWFQKSDMYWFVVRAKSYAYILKPGLRKFALDVLKEELHKLKDLMKPSDVAMTKSRMAKLHLDRNEFPEALVLLQEAETLLADSLPCEQRAYFLLTSSYCQFALGDYDAASTYAFEAVDVYSSLRNFQTELKEALQIGKEAVLKLRPL